MTTARGASRLAVPVPVACVLLAVAAGSVAAQEGRATAIRLAATESIRLDGLLAEETWSVAEPLTGFRQRDPDEGAPATERTEVRLVYGDAALYVGIQAFDEEPDEVVARILQRDKIFVLDAFSPQVIRPAGDDAIAITFDAFDDDRGGVMFGTNPNGAEFEALISNDGAQVNIDWRGVWDVAAAVTDEGWSAEMAIPWRTLRYPDAGPDHEWGVNVYRIIRRKNEDTYWQAWDREGGGIHRVSRAGSLAGLADLPRQGLNLEAKPYLLSGVRQEDDGTGTVSSSGDISTGIDLKTEVRPGLLLDVTVNTDFAQVEVDDAQVNLTRFNLFFPEKRDFFLENAGVFDFGLPANPMEPPPYQMFFSRQIGISDDGEIPIRGGARLTGRVGGQTVGFMNVQTGPAHGVAAESFSVARVKRDVGSSNYIGAMMVDRRGDGPTNTVAGADARIQLTDAWAWDFFLTKSETAGVGGDGYAYSAAYQYFGESWGSFFNHYGIEGGAEASAGFITRSDFRRTDLYGGPTFRPDVLGLREVQLFVGGTYASTMSDGRLQDWNTGFFLAPAWHSGDNIGVFVNTAETVVDDPFDLTDNITIPVGRYDADHLGWFGGTNPARTLFLTTNGIVTRFHGGSLVTVSNILTAAPSPTLSLALGLTRNVVDVPQGDFTADITSLRATLSFSTKLSTNVLVQYNSLDEEFSTNVRFNFIHRPGSDLFVVFTENRGDGVRTWHLQDRGLVMKLTYLARL